MDYRRGDGAATSAPLLQAGGNGHLTEMHHSSHPPPRRKLGLFAWLIHQDGECAYHRLGIDSGWLPAPKPF